jgi:hypothetical protein
MRKEVFADHITSALIADISIMDSIAGMNWGGNDKQTLIVRVQPVNQEAWKEIGQLIVEQLRRATDTLKFKAQVQKLKVEGNVNLFFALRPA